MEEMAGLNGIVYRIMGLEDRKWDVGGRRVVVVW